MLIFLSNHSELWDILPIRKNKTQANTSIYFILHRLSLNQLDYSEVPQNIKKTKQKYDI